MALLVCVLNHIAWFALSIWFYSNYYCLLNVLFHSQRHKTAITRISGGKFEMKCSFLAHPRARFDAEFSLLQILRMTTKSFQQLKYFIFTDENRHERSRRFSVRVLQNHIISICYKLYFHVHPSARYSISLFSFDKYVILFLYYERNSCYENIPIYKSRSREFSWNKTFP